MWIIEISNSIAFYIGWTCKYLLQINVYLIDIIISTKYPWKLYDVSLPVNYPPEFLLVFCF